MEKTDTFDFGTAIRKLKAGGKVARSGWNGKGMHLKLVTPRWTATATVRAASLDGRAPHVTEPPEVYGQIGTPTIVMFTAQGTFQSWNASQADALAEDWSDPEAPRRSAPLSDAEVIAVAEAEMGQAGGAAARAAMGH